MVYRGELLQGQLLNGANHIARILKALHMQVIFLLMDLDVS